MDTPASLPPAAEAAPAGPSGRLWNRSFSLLWMGQTISHLGNPAFNIGAMLWMKDVTGSASLMGMLMMASALPTLLLSPFGGTFVDRHSRVRIMIWGDLVSGLALAGFTAAVWLRPMDKGLVVPLLFAVAIALGVVRAVFMPAVNAILPDLVPKEKLPAANSLAQLSVQASIFLGQAVGGVLYKAVGAAVLFLIDGVSFLLAALFTLGIPRDRRPAKPAVDSETHPWRRFFADTFEGFRYVWAQKGERDFLFATALINFLAMPGFVLFPFYVERTLHASPSWYGFLISGVGVGVALGFLVAGVIRLSGTARAWGILTAMVLYPVFFGSLALWRSPFPALVAAVLGGAVTGFVNVYLMTMSQASTPAELRGRVMAFLNLLSGGLIPVGMALGGFVGDLTNKNAPLVIGCCAVLALLVVFLLGFRRPCREYLAS